MFIETIREKLNNILLESNSVADMFPNDIKSDHSVINELMDAHNDYQNILKLLNDVMSDVKAVLPKISSEGAPIEYDLDMAWAYSVYESLEEAKKELESCSNDLDFILSEIEVGDDIDDNEFLVYEYEIHNFINMVEKAIKETFNTTNKKTVLN